MELIEISGPRIRAVPATLDRAAEVQACLDGAPGYFEETEGAPAPSDAALRLLADAEADPDRRVFLLVARKDGPRPFVVRQAHRERQVKRAGAEEEALGVLDLYLHQPEPRVAHVGLLLLREAVQGRGLGREVVEALSRALAAEGFTELRASVADETAGAREFWERLGFAAAGRLERGIMVYALRLASS